MHLCILICCRTSIWERRADFMKIGALGLYPNSSLTIKSLFAANKNVENNAVNPFCAQNNSLYSTYIPKNFFVANSNISFKGVECSPGNFKIKTAYGVECPCCGQVMLTKKQSNAFVARISDKKGADLQKELEKESSYFRKNEQQIADILIEDSKQNPDLNLSQLVALEAKESIAQLESEQKNIIGQMRTLSEGLTPKKRERLSKILDEEESLIDNSDDYVHFKRKNFVDKIEYFHSQCGQKDLEVAGEISALAQTMPTSGTSKDAFFVKYQRRTNEDIARRLVLPAMVTTEHIRPQSKNGKNSTDNYIPLCGDCNSRRGNTPYNEWFKIRPEMPQNLQEYIYQISDIIQNKGFDGWEFYDTYVDDVIKAVYRETNGKLKLKTPEEAQMEEKQPEVEAVIVPPKTIEEQREIWMSRYETLTAQISDLHALRDELYADEEFLNILQFLQMQDRVNSSKQTRKVLHRNFMNATSSFKRAKRELKKAKNDGESVEKIRELQNRVQNSKGNMDAAKGDYVAESQRYSSLLAQRDEIKKLITTPEEIIAEIHKTKQQKAESEQQTSLDTADSLSKDVQLSALNSSSLELERLIEQKKAANAKKEQTLDFDSPKSKKVASRYFELQAKMNMLNSMDMETFRKLFADNQSSISPDFIVVEAKAAIQKQLANVLKSPVAHFYKTKDEIAEFEFRKRVIDSEISKLTSKVDYDAKLQDLYKRKAEIQKKFSNVNIDKTIERLQMEADDNLQKFTDSFENYGGYQHSKPKADGTSSS